MEFRRVIPNRVTNPTSDPSERPLFHSNPLMCGYVPTLIRGSTMALASRFSVRRFLPDVRMFGATYFPYSGKPLSHLLTAPEKPNDADNPLRVAYGNEGSWRTIDRFERRYGKRRKSDA